MEQEKIEFYIPKDETIPTRLMLKAGDTQISYEHTKGMFGYDFCVFTTDEERAMKLTREIGAIMETQSYDHGVYWRIIKTSLLSKEMSCCNTRVLFTRHDPY